MRVRALSRRSARVCLASALVVAAGCTTVYRTVKESDLALPAAGAVKVDAFQVVTKTLEEDGFRLQKVNRAQGEIQTDWRTYATLPSHPPVDVCMQITAHIVDENEGGRTHVRLRPRQRKVDRGGGYYAEEEVFIDLKDSNCPNDWKLYAWGAELYADLVDRICTGLGTSRWAVRHEYGTTVIDGTLQAIRDNL